MGAPLTLTPAVQAEIVKAIEGGNSLEAAMEAHGYHPEYGYQWVARGRNGEEPFASFSAAVTRARGKAEMSAVAALRSGFQEDWKAAEAWLKRARHRTWGDRQNLEVQKAEGAINLGALSSEELHAYYQLRLKATTHEAERAELMEHIEAVKGLLVG
jgi:hypothetical protein